MYHLNDIATGKELGRKTQTWRKYIWHACVDCGKERWVLLIKDLPRNIRCHACSNKLNPIKKKTYLSGGYRYVKLNPDEKFFSSMTIANGYIKEHRLIMAKALGRNLHSWEVVHHKNHIKDDNRIENLQLVSADKHTQITLLENRVAHLEIRVTQLEAENILLKSGVGNHALAN